jgi:hypothetical protein
MVQYLAAWHRERVERRLRNSSAKTQIIGVRSRQNSGGKGEASMKKMHVFPCASALPSMKSRLSGEGVPLIDRLRIVQIVATSPSSVNVRALIPGVSWAAFASR